jgi:hypothetical protein
MAARPKAPPLPGIDPLICEGPAFEALGDHMQRLRAERGRLATADGTHLRGSTALNCARAIAFEAMQVEPAVPLSTEALVIFDVGHAYHDRIQAGLHERFGAQLEVVCSWWPEYDMSTHADAVYPLPSGNVAVEIKSAKAYAYDLVVKGNPYDHTGPGPKREHLIQAGLSGLSPGVDAKWVHMIYLNKDTGEMAEWLIGVHTPLVHLGGDCTVATLTHDELARQDAILRLVQAGTMPAREIPNFGLVRTRPPAASSKDKPWNCRYCAWQPHCAQQPAEAFPLEDTPWQLPTRISSTSSSSTDDRIAS